MSEREAHIDGLLRLVDEDAKPRVKRWIESANGRSKLLKWLAHGSGLDTRYCHEPPRGQREGEQLLLALRARGAPRTCYVVSSDGHLDDGFCQLEQLLTLELGHFTHGTIISAIPGKLGLFRSAYPHRHLIVHRPD